MRLVFEISQGAKVARVLWLFAKCNKALGWSPRALASKARRGHSVGDYVGATLVPSNCYFSFLFRSSLVSGQKLGASNRRAGAKQIHHQFAFVCVWISLQPSHEKSFPRHLCRCSRCSSCLQVISLLMPVAPGTGNDDWSSPESAVLGQLLIDLYALQRLGHWK